MSQISLARLSEFLVEAKRQTYAGLDDFRHAVALVAVLDLGSGSWGVAGAFDERVPRRRPDEEEEAAPAVPFHASILAD